jgi:iron(III) transport system ATP-binding protein
MKSITIDHVTKRYGFGPTAFQALTDINITIEAGEFFFLLGPSGCGKTTLLRTIAGLHAPTQGRILLGDEDVTNQPVHKRNTAMVFQSYALWPHMTVGQNVQFGPKMKGLPAPQRQSLAEQNLKLVQLDHLAQRKPNELSGGQQQRVALARALAYSSDCLLLDEPLSNLDARLRMQMRTELRRLVKDSGATAVYVTHDQKEALSMADRIAVLHEGRIAQIGTPEDVYNRPASTFVADFIGEANFLPGTVQSPGEVASVDTPAGPVRSAVTAEASTGQAVTCCVRPEWVRIVPRGQAPATATALPAVIDTEVYLGEIRQYFCRLANDDTWRINTLGEQTAPFAPGAEVDLAIAPGDVCLLPA